MVPLENNNIDFIRCWGLCCKENDFHRFLKNPGHGKVDFVKHAGPKKDRWGTLLIFPLSGFIPWAEEVPRRFTLGGTMVLPLLNRRQAIYVKG